MESYIFLLTLASLILSVLVGYFIAWLCRDELKQGRKWFKLLIALSFLTGIVFLFYYKIEIVLTCAVIIIISVISLVKGYDRKWVGKI